MTTRTPQGDETALGYLPTRLGSGVAAAERRRIVRLAEQAEIDHVARQLIDLAGLAPGRFVFGVGIGGEDPHEVEIFGIAPRSRGRRMDECVQIVRTPLTGKPVDFDGELFTIEQARLVPAPTEPLPIVVGGRSDAAVDRAGRLGDGWFGIRVSARRYTEAVARTTDAAGRAGRRVQRWVDALNVWCGAGRTASDPRRHVAAGEIRSLASAATA